MTMESDLTVLLKTVSPRVFPDVAPSGTAVPYVTYQHIGGTSLQYIDGTAADKRHTVLQINVWSASRLEALALIRQVEATICNLAAAPFAAQPDGEPTGRHEDDVTPPLYGCMQDFSIISTR
jgi:hypothetical protein